MYDEKFKETLENEIHHAAKSYGPVYALDELLKVIADICGDIGDNET